MRLVEFVARFNRNSGGFNSYLVIRSNPKPNYPSYYFRNVSPLNVLFKDLLHQSQLSIASFESLFLQNLPDCLSQIKIKSTTSENEVFNSIRNYFLKMLV
jgi:hypothetical protein